MTLCSSGCGLPLTEHPGRVGGGACLLRALALARQERDEALRQVAEADRARIRGVASSELLVTLDEAVALGPCAICHDPVTEADGVGTWAGPSGERATGVAHDLCCANQDVARLTRELAEARAETARVRAATDAPTHRAPEAAPAHYCNKCGYVGMRREHPGCSYDGAPVAPPPVTREELIAMLESLLRACEGTGLYDPDARALLARIEKESAR